MNDVEGTRQCSCDIDSKIKATGQIMNFRVKLMHWLETKASIAMLYHRLQVHMPHDVEDTGQRFV